MTSSTKPAVLAVISDLDIGTDTSDTATPASISDAQHQASYSWLAADQPTIAIPGSPARWSPPSYPQRVKKDAGFVYIAQNAARHPDSPLEPLFRALYAEKPSFDMMEVDLVTDRNNLRKLLSFVDPSSSRNGIEPFTIDVEVNNSTVLFCRTETKTYEFIGPNDFHGYGHEFEKAYTTETTPGNTGHHRIITYQFGGLRFVVRYETDAFVADKTSTTSTPRTRKTNDDADDLSGLLSSLSLTQSPGVPSASARLEVTVVPGSKLRVKKQGHSVPPESTLEIKTRVAHKRLDFSGVAPQLWFSQTPKLVRAYHTGGIFQVPSVEDVSSEVKRWETSNQRHLRQLASLIGRILQVVKEHGGRSTIRCEKGQEHKLTVYSDTSGKKMLPQDLYSKWATKELETKPMTKDTAPAEDQIIDATSLRVHIGVREYLIDKQKIPYFQSFTGYKNKDNKDAVPWIVHEDIAFLGDIDYAVRHGFRHFFRRIPADVAEYRRLCNSLQFLKVDVCEGRTVRDLMHGMREGKDDDYDGMRIRGNKSVARDAAFRLVYAFIVNEGGGSASGSDKAMAYNATFFVVSHPGIFRDKTRAVVRKTFENRFGVTNKQTINLDKWKDKGQWQTEEDGTTEEEEYDYGHDHDWDFD